MYAKDKELLKDPYWKWTQYYLDDNSCTNVLLNIYKATSSPTEQGGKTFKFEYEVPKNARHALAMDKAAGNDEWAKSMGLELGQLNDFKVFKVLPDHYILPKEYKRIPYQIVFDVKFDGQKKSHLVAGGHRTPYVSKEEVFSGVVSMEAVRLGFILAHLNGLQV